MAVYGVGGAAAGASCDYDPFGTTSTNQAGCISYRQSLIGATNTANHVYLYHNLVSDANSPGVEKLSTRSPTASANYFGSVSSPSQPIIVCAMAPYNNSAWIAHPRYSPMCSSDIGDVIAAFIQTDLSQPGKVQMSVDEDVLTHKWVRGRMRRTSKRGFFSMFGNSINRVATSGGGSFSATYPVFQHDITWTDESAWRNGSNRQSTWNINILGTAVARRRTLMGAGL